MNRENWHELLALESTDISRNWYKTIHGRSLNLRRAREINAAAKQAREYFRNASNSDYSVRPLLIYYGVSSLSRSMLLLLNRDGGEECITGGHGLQAVDWGRQLSGEASKGLKKLLDLKVQTCGGLFNDFLRVTQNRISLHVRSSGVDGRIRLAIPEQGSPLTLSELFARIPDLHKDYSNISTDIRYASINKLSIDQELVTTSS